MSRSAVGSLQCFGWRSPACAAGTADVLRCRDAAADAATLAASSRPSRAEADSVRELPCVQAIGEHLRQRPELFPNILSTLFEIALFENCTNQWSLSRPMLPLILLNEQARVSCLSRLPDQSVRLNATSFVRPQQSQSTGEASERESRGTEGARHMHFSRIVPLTCRA